MFIDRILRKRKNENNNPEPPFLKPFSAPEFHEPKTTEFHDFANDFVNKRQEFPRHDFPKVGIEENVNNVFMKPRDMEPQEKKDFDKTDLILQKLETIEARLKLIENRLERRVV